MFLLHNFVTSLIAIEYSGTIGFCVLITTLYRYLSPDGLMPTSLCILIGNVDASAFPTLVAILYTLLHSVSVITIPLINVMLIIEIKKSDKIMQHMRALGQKKYSLPIWKIISESVCNIIFWLSSMVLLLVTFLWKEYPFSILIWMVIFFLSYNVILNPFILVLYKELNEYLKKIISYT